jgi:rubrerythrin
MPLQQEGSMDRFIQSENIQRYRKLLERATDESQRQQLLKLLSEEEMKSPRVESPQER